MDQFAFTETLETEDFRVRGERVGRDLIGSGSEGSNDTSRLVDGSVLVELIDIDLEVLSGLGEAKWVEATVTGKGAIEPVGADGVGEPESLTSCKEKMKSGKIEQGCG